MRVRHVVSSVGFWVLAAAVQAAPPPPVITVPGLWAPAPSARGSGDYHAGWRWRDTRAPSPFRFDTGRRGPYGTLPPSPMDQAAVMGSGRAWSDGRPPLDCARTPMDARCH
jgi:hypothetical protein